MKIQEVEIVKNHQEKEEKIETGIAEVEEIEGASAAVILVPGQDLDLIIGKGGHPGLLELMCNRPKKTDNNNINNQQV